MHVRILAGLSVALMLLGGIPLASAEEVEVGEDGSLNFSISSNPAPAAVKPRPKPKHDQFLEDLRRVEREQSKYPQYEQSHESSTAGIFPENDVY